MIRMKNRINQVVVGEDMTNPIECDVTSVYRQGKEDRGKVSLNGKKQRVKHIGGGVWLLTDGSTTTSEKEREAA